MDVTGNSIKQMSQIQKKNKNKCLFSYIHGIRDDNGMSQEFSADYGIRLL